MDLFHFIYVFSSLCPLDETEDNSFLTKLKKHLKKFWKKKDKDSSEDKSKELSDGATKADSAEIENTDETENTSK